MRRIMECETESGKSIKQILQNKYRMSAALITALKKNPNGIMVNGEKKYVNYILQGGDKLTVTFEETGSVNIEPVSMRLDILYEDEYILAVAKPADMAVHVSHGNVNNTLSNGVLYYLNNKYNEPYKFHAVTRLDKNTSGIVVIAKTAYIHDALSRSLREKTFFKEYTAVVCKRLTGSGEINAPIARESESIITRCVREDGLFAVTRYESAVPGDDYSLVRLCPVTGRTHQLRVHMAYIGHPIAGDDLYGAEKIKENRHLLHCGRVVFQHPVTGNKLEIVHKVPDCFLEYIYKNKKTID